MNVFRPFFVVLQDLLVDCYKPTEVSFFLPSMPRHFTPISTVCTVALCFMSLNPPHAFCPSCLPVGLRVRAARQDPRDAEALHASEEMMASLLLPYILPSISALTSCLPAALSTFLF